MKDYLTAGLIAAVGFAAPVIPHIALQLLDNILIRILVVAALLFSITKGPMIGIAIYFNIISMITVARVL